MKNLETKNVVGEINLSELKDSWNNSKQSWIEFDKARGLSMVHTYLPEDDSWTHRNIDNLDASLSYNRETKEQIFEIYDGVGGVLEEFAVHVLHITIPKTDIYSKEQLCELDWEIPVADYIESQWDSFDEYSLYILKCFESFNNVKLFGDALDLLIDTIPDFYLP